MAQMSWNEACQLDPSLLSLSSAIPDPVKAETLSGLTNLVWKLSFEAEPPLIWRPITPITQAFSISRQQESHILTLLSDYSQLTVPQVRFLNSQGLLVTWIEGELVHNVNQDVLLNLLSRIHRVDLSKCPIVPFSYTARVDHYWLQLQGSSNLPEKVDEVYQQWRLMPSIDPVPLTLCHFDLGAYNLIKTPQGYTIIDWEYASLADPRLELAMLVEQEAVAPAPFVARYCQLQGIDHLDEWIEAVKAWQPRVQMMSMLWFFLAHRYWGNDEYLVSAHALLEKLCL